MAAGYTAAAVLYKNGIPTASKETRPIATGRKVASSSGTGQQRLSVQSAEGSRDNG
jgi:hypothetical protein